MKIMAWKFRRTALVALALALGMVAYAAAYPSLAGAYATDRPLPICCVDTNHGSVKDCAQIGLQTLAE